MSTFSFDTSGVVYVGSDHRVPGGHVEWSDLSPFVQGYVEALFASLPVLCTKCEGNGEIVTDWQAYLHPPEGAEPDAGTATCPACDGQERIAYRFDRLDPSALALILRDCEAASQRQDFSIPCAASGRLLWRDRQAGLLPDFPPQQPYLSEEGRVCLQPLSEHVGERV